MWLILDEIVTIPSYSSCTNQRSSFDRSNIKMTIESNDASSICIGKKPNRYVEVENGKGKRGNGLFPIIVTIHAIILIYRMTRYFFLYAVLCRRVSAMVNSIAE